MSREPEGRHAKESGGPPAADSWQLLRRFVEQSDYTSEPAYADLLRRLSGLDSPHLQSGQPLGDPDATVGFGDVVRAEELGASVTLVGRFRLRTCLGTSSSSDVYLADDPLLGRQVALKLPHLSMGHSAEVWSRFMREVRATAVLNHPNIIPLLDAGRADGRVFLAYQYCPGPTLSRFLKESSSPLPPHLAARVVADLADAVHHAHEAGILHRDVKPGNILLDPRPQAGAAFPFTPKLTDFGLAKVADEQDSTRSGVLLGTINYMSPEQARGQVRDICAGSDVYGLGAVLYELLVRQPPLRGSSEVETLRMICDDEPLAPRHRVPGIPRDLEAICLRCLEKRARQRYASAADLRDDLRRFLNQQPVTARSISRLEHVWRWTRRRPASAAVLLLSLTVVAGLMGGLFFHNWRLSQAVEQTDRMKERAEQSARESRRLLYSAHMRLAFTAWQDRDPAMLAEYLALGEPATDFEDLRGFEWYLLRRELRESRAELRAQAGPLYSVALSPDGTRLATAGESGVVHLWRLPERQREGTWMGHEGDINSLAFSPDGRTLATVGDDGTLRLWETGSGAVRTANPQEGPLLGVAFSPDGSRLATGSRDGYVHLWNPQGESLSRRGPQPASVHDVQFHPGGRKLAAATGKLVQVWQLDDSQPPQTLRGCRSTVTFVQFDPQGEWIAGGGHDDTLFLWQVQSGALVRRFPGHRDWVRDVAFSADGQRLASVGKDGTVWLWPLHRLQPDQLVQVAQDSRDVTGIACSRTDGVLWTADSQGAIVAWTAEGGRIAEVSDAHAEGIAAIALAPDGARCATVGRLDRTLRIWEGSRLEPRFTQRRAGIMRDVEFSRDGLRLAVAEDERVVVWDTSSYAEPLVLEGHAAAVRGVAFAPDGMHIAAVGADHKLCVWQVADGRRVGEIPHPEPLHSVNYSPDGRFLLTGDQAGALRIWMAAALTFVDAVYAHEGPLTDIAFTADGARAATCSRNRTICIWDPRDWRCEQRLARDCEFHSLAFSPDGGRLFASGSGPSLYTWFEPLQPAHTAIGRHSQQALSVTFTPDDAQLITTGFEGRIKIWSLVDAHPLGPARRLPRRVTDVAFAGPSRALFATSVEGTLLNWNLAARSREWSFSHEAHLQCVAAARQGRWVAAGGTRGQILLFQDHSPRAVSTIQAHTDVITELSFSADGTWLASASRDQHVRVWEVPSLALLRDFTATTHHASETVFSPRGTWLAIDQGNSILLWDLAREAAARKFAELAAPIDQLAFSPDERLLASGHSDRTIRVWDPRTGELLAELLGHRQPIYALAFAPDGRTLASGSSDGTLRFWHVATWQELGMLLQEEQAVVVGLDFASDAHWFAAGLNGNPRTAGLRLWQAGSGEEGSAALP